MPTERDVLFLSSSSSASANKVFPEPLTLKWRKQHLALYLIGGVTFLWGSIQYLPSIDGFTLGALLFTIGNASFLYCDVIEWHMNNRVGCCFDRQYRDDYEKQEEVKRCGSSQKQLEEGATKEQRTG
jgi:hypothetical protein